MQISAALNQRKYEAFRWRYQASLPWKITLALLMAGLTGLLAQVRIVLPFTPVPLTGQTFGVLLAGVLLGRKWGGISLAIYTILGIAGVPWLNGATSGLTATGGYLIGFVLAAFFLGYMTDNNPKYRSFRRDVRTDVIRQPSTGLYPRPSVAGLLAEYGKGQPLRAYYP